MATNTLGRGAIAMALAAALGVPSARSQPTDLVVPRDTADYVFPGDTFRASGPGTAVVHVEPRATLDAEGARFINDGPGIPTARTYGIIVSEGADLSLAGSDVAVSGPWGVGIALHRAGEASLDDVRVDVDGEHSVGLLLAGGSRASVVRSRVLADGAGGQAIGARFQGGGTATVRLENTAVHGRVESGTPGLSIHAEGGSIDGDIVRGGVGALTLRLSNGAWRGRGDRLSSLSLTDATWTVTGDSVLGEVRLEAGGRIVLDRSQPGFRTVRAGTWHAAIVAEGLTIRTRLDAGGALRQQATDRLLVQGDALGRTALHVDHVGGYGAATAGRDGTNGPGDGISVVQVGGVATAESFHLAGNYVVVGPWQYGLTAYAPGRSDPAQRLVDGQGGDYWDFRLQSVRTGVVASRAALAPQVPAYLALGHALFGYGRSAMDALRAVEVASSREPVLRVRTFGSDVRYRSRPSRASYGVDYRRRDHGLQIAGDIVVHAIGDTTLRTGFALSAGSSRILPLAADGRSDARANARGLAWHALLATEGGWELASTYGFTHYRIDAHTPARGEVLPRLRAIANETIVSIAYRWRPSTRLLVEPGASLLWQRLDFGKARDRDGIDLSARSPRRLTARTGARASLLFQPEGRAVRAWSPYLDLRYGVARDTDTVLRASGERLPTERGARIVELAAGAGFELGARWSASVDATARLRGRGGESGQVLRLGASWAFR